MGELSEQNRAHDLEARIFDWLGRKYVQRSDERQRAMGLQYTTAETHDLAKGLAALLDAARTEGREEGEPAGLDAPLPCDVSINHITYRQGVSLRTLVEAATRWHTRASEAFSASPIREPEISRTKRDEIARIIDPEIFADLDLVASQAPQFIPTYSGQRTVDAAYVKADAILNLAPVAKGVSHDADLSDEFDRPGRLSDATRHSAEGTADPALSGARGVGEGWRPISEAPRDGSYILAHVADRDADDRWAHLAGRAFVVRHEGKTSSGYDLGWSVHPGFGGCADDWFSGWQPLPPLPEEGNRDS